jgi:hypothetical protein
MTDDVGDFQVEDRVISYEGDKGIVMEVIPQNHTIVVQFDDYFLELHWKTRLLTKR